MPSEYLIELARSMGGVVTHTTPRALAFVLEGERYLMHIEGDDVILTQRSGAHKGQRAVIEGAWGEQRFSDSQKIKLAQ